MDRTEWVVIGIVFVVAAVGLVVQAGTLAGKAVDEVTGMQVRVARGDGGQAGFAQQYVQQRTAASTPCPQPSCPTGCNVVLFSNQCAVAPFTSRASLRYSGQARQDCPRPQGVCCCRPSQPLRYQDALRHEEVDATSTVRG